MSDPAMERVRRERAATYADLAQVPEGQIAQIVEGELFVLPRPAVPHTITSSAAGASCQPPICTG